MLTPFSTLLVIPDDPEAATAVNNALQYAEGQSGFAELNTLVRRSQETISAAGLGVGRHIQSAQVGEAIGILQFAQFAWDDMDSGVKLLDFDDAREQHYATRPGANSGPNPQVHEDYNEGNTEFYLLPELASAASIELRRQNGRVIPSVLIPRLYGSELVKGSALPTILDLFYLSRVRCRLVRAAEGLRIEWKLVVDGDRFMPLVTYNGNPYVGNDDLLGNARPAFIALDTFIAAMGYRQGGAVVPKWVIPGNALEVRTHETDWPGAVQIRNEVRRLLVDEWQSLMPDQSNTAAVEQTYHAMWNCAREDAAAIALPDTKQGRDVVSREWADICRIVFNNSLANLGASFQL
jgi:hypothetical protein